MATNEVYRTADRLSLPVVAGTEAGDPVVVGGLVGVAATDRGADGMATVWRCGAHRFEVAGAITTVGQPVYYVGDGTTRNPQLTTTSSGNARFGYALETKSAGAADVTVTVARRVAT